MAEGVVAEAGDEGEGEGVSAEQVVEIIERGFHVAWIGREGVGDQELHAVVGGDGVGAPNVIASGEADSIGIGGGALDDLAGGCEGGGADGGDGIGVLARAEDVGPEGEVADAGPGLRSGGADA